MNAGSSKVVVRRGGAQDVRFLRDMLHHAYYWKERAPDTGPGPVALYVKAWGRPVVPNARGKGVGSALLEALLDRARGAGYGSISLSVDRNNAGAIELYERHGFSRVGEDADSFTMLAPLEPTSPTNEGTDTE